MPLATTSQEGERFDLKSCPGAYVVLKGLTYGQKLRRMEMASKMSLDMDRRNKGAVKGEMEMLQFNATRYDFRSCIIQHNLEKDIGTKEEPKLVLLDFNNDLDFVALDPRVGEEISRLIDKLNNFEDELEAGNSPS